MTSRIALAAATFGTVTAAVTAGVYLNFSARVMPSLGRMAGSAGLARMQGFNRTAVQPPFMICFFGAAFVGGYLVYRVVRGDRSGADLLLAAGGTAYLLGFVLTIAYNVPLNDKLAALDPDAPSSIQVWRDYLTSWTAANTVRAVLSTLAVGLLIAGTVSGLRSGRNAATPTQPDQVRSHVAR
ncbi:DUF1772 domain-containing protein [Flexivirga sp. ID2601S]|uniref:DUF1772 domain-containing protein n=1 Tax=Flexivirga aerilata TaxID=1656889 RepID=A0A849AHE6_9MICO|nr:anthrone oxygenase family protein [Flexivirga aerilata]NNG38986.1 DUF1772 domain-containing protein [Flexivirga aerilata]